jgi:hypothetical protein
MSVTLIIVKNLTFTVNGYKPQWKIYLMSDVFNLGCIGSDYLFLYFSKQFIIFFLYKWWRYLFFFDKKHISSLFNKKLRGNVDQFKKT